MNPAVIMPIVVVAMLACCALGYLMGVMKCLARISQMTEDIKDLRADNHRLVVMAANKFDRIDPSTKAALQTAKLPEFDHSTEKTQLINLTDGGQVTAHYVEILDKEKDEYTGSQRFHLHPGGLNMRCESCRAIVPSNQVHTCNNIAPDQTPYFLPVDADPIATLGIKARARTKTKP